MQRTTAVEDYLKAIHSLQQGEQYVANGRLAAHFNVSAPAITDMIKKLAVQGLVVYRSREGVRLTARGEELTLKILQRHRLVELYLVKAVGMSPHDAHAEAEVLEHHLSDSVAGRISTYLDGLPGGRQDEASMSCLFNLGELSGSAAYLT